MSGIDWREQGYVKAALITGLLCVLVFTAMVYGVLRYQASEQVDDLKANEYAKVKLTKGLLEQAFDYVASDLLTIAKLPATELYNSDRNETGKIWLTQVFTVQLEQKSIYGQLRYLDSNGAERIRVDYSSGRSFVIPEHQLQPKGDRYYFIDTWALSAGEVYVSPLDLNVEQGVVEIPYLPIVRFGVPIFDTGGHKRGAVILSVKGQSLLDTFRLGMTHTYPAYLLNNEGHILTGPDKSREWGFMFDLPPAFREEYPQAWQHIMQTESGTVETPAGLFVFETVRPLQRIDTRPGREIRPVTRAGYQWKTVSFIPQNKLPSADLFGRSWVTAGYVSVVALLLMAAFYFQFSRHKRRQLRRENEQQSRRFRTISSVLGNGLIVMDKDGIVTYINPEAERILGWRADELVTRKGHQVFHVHGDDESSCPILGVMDTHQLYRSDDEEFRRKDNSTFPVMLNAAPLTSDTGDAGVVISFQDFSEIKTYQEEIRSLAYHDILTGLPNRRVLDDRLQLAIALSERHDRYLALMFLDLDHFKAVNDTYGHEAGDILLKDIAARLTACVRETDTVVRMGGDEFIILLTEVSAPENATIVAEKIIHAIGQPVTLPDGEAVVGVSIGVAVARGKGMTAEGLVQAADAAMYEAKDAGRNTLVARVIEHGKAE